MKLACADTGPCGRRLIMTGVGRSCRCGGRHTRTLQVAIVLILLALDVSGSIPAEGIEDPQLKAREALRQERFPWYDQGADDVRVVPFRVSTGAEARYRHSTWVDGPDLGQVNSNLSSRSGGFRLFSSEVWSAVAWGVGILFLLGVVVLLVWTFVKVLNNESDREDSIKEADADSIRVQNQVDKLPFEIADPTRDLLAAARKSYESGDVRQAIIYLFGYQLVHLDSVQAIQLEDGKTNRQCLAELAGSKLHAILERTMLAFEDVFFGELPLEPAVFDQCWNDLDRFHQYAKLLEVR
ncbi:MAG: hypothetical protein VX346_22485 [Planctomycetota bacterium]|nr:hypothetical protein [Planctomycetota bacterium]